MEEKELEKYIRILEEHGQVKADLYKNTLVPKTLYKYIYLSDNIDENEKKINALENNQIWVSRYTNLNDPFEFGAMYIDDMKMKNEGCKNDEIEITKLMYEEKKNLLRICSFSERIQNMPMWAHYANNHKGFCVEYEVSDPKKIYPVIYTETRQENHNLIVQMVKTFYNLNRQEERNDHHAMNAKTFDDAMKYISYIYLINATKNSSWSYEKEYRIIFAKFEPDKSNGELVRCSDCGIKAKRVYVGNSCNEKHIKRIKDISKKIGLENSKKMCLKNGVTFELDSCEI